MLVWAALGLVLLMSLTAQYFFLRWGSGAAGRTGGLRLVLRRGWRGMRGSAFFPLLLVESVGSLLKGWMDAVFALLAYRCYAEVWRVALVLNLVLAFVCCVRPVWTFLLGAASGGGAPAEQEVLGVQLQKGASLLGQARADCCFGLRRKVRGCLRGLGRWIAASSAGWAPEEPAQEQASRAGSQASRARA
jgi:hypothetical protein